MKLSRESRLARFCYLGRRMPKKTTLCAFFWQAFVIMPILCLFAASTVGILLFFVGREVVKNWVPFTIGFSIIGLLIFVIIRYGAAVDKYLRDKETERQMKYWSRDRSLDKKSLYTRVKESFFIQGAISLKKKFCPIIELGE